ncbi:MAG TPA: peptide ABC transporter substrate-binding protein [Chloroflexota bacterium]|nr:peptide ABC transporter substrate-binding protein [Chloroflexota bacterium]
MPPLGLRHRSLIAILLLASVACTTPNTGVRGSESTDARAVGSTGQKRIIAAVLSDPPTISSEFIGIGSGTIQGGGALEELTNRGLSVQDNRGTLVAQLAEAVPSVENGLWQLLPDGRMETTWKIKDRVSWHDGTPFTSSDLVFTIQLGQDRDLPVFGHNGFDSIASVDAPDARTIVIRWKRPYVDADSLFTRRFGFPRPRHVLEQVYLDNKDAIGQQPYWTEAYVGTGPFRVKQWVADSHVVLRANDAYVLGRPKIDEIEVRFIPNPNTLVANILAGEVELTLGRSLQMSETSALRDSWTKGAVAVGITDWIALWVQFVNPGQPLLLDASFRKALVQAIDRQQMVEVLESGAVPVAHSFISPREAVYPEIEPSIVKYDFDPRRSGQLIEQLGFTRGGDGMYQRPSGERLTLDVWTNPGHEERILAITDYFKQAGIAAESFVIPDARRRDREYNTSYPGVRLWRLPNSEDDIAHLHSREAPMPENRFSGGNRSRYMNPTFDALIDQFMTTIPHTERVAILGQIVHHMTDQLPVIGIYYNAQPTMIGARLKNVMPADSGNSTEAWNAQDWDVVGS